MEKLVSVGKMSQTKVPVNTNKTHVSVGKAPSRTKIPANINKPMSVLARAATYIPKCLCTTLHISMCTTMYYNVLQCTTMYLQCTTLY
jgi:hypothetical protein